MKDNSQKEQKKFPKPSFKKHQYSTAKPFINEFPQMIALNTLNLVTKCLLQFKILFELANS